MESFIGGVGRLAVGVVSHSDEALPAGDADRGRRATTRIECQTRSPSGVDFQLDLAGGVHHHIVQMHDSAAGLVVFDAQKSGQALLSCGDWKFHIRQIQLRLELLPIGHCPVSQHRVAQQIGRDSLLLLLRLHLSSQPISSERKREFSIFNLIG